MTARPDPSHGARRTRRIGPNAITRLAEALRLQFGAESARRVFQAAGQSALLASPPQQMVDEGEVAALYGALREQLDAARAAQAARTAGELTGDYLLAHRIPRLAQTAMRRLPASLAARVLRAAITRHAWTFAGSGTFESTVHRRSAALTITGCPLCRGASATDPVCDYFAATFERLFRALVSRGASVTETACQATGAAACEFEVRW